MQLFASQRRGSAGVLFAVFAILFGCALSSAAWADTSDLLPPPRLVSNGARTTTQFSPNAITSAGLDLSKAGDWLVAQQVTTGANAGAFPWTPGDTTVYTNTQGASALGLLRLYKLNADSALLNAAILNGQCQITNCIAGWTYPNNGTHRFATHDPLFLIELSQFSGDPQYAQYVTDHFWTPLSTSSYGDTADAYDAAGFTSHILAGRASIPELAAWDISKLVVAAREAGQSTAETAFMNGVLASLNAADGSHTTYDVVGLTGAVWASAVSGIDLDPTSGTWASANSTADLAAMLLAHQAPGGGFVGSTASAVTDANADIQTTGYAMLALATLDRATYLPNLQSAAGFIATLQQPDGEILSYAGAPTNSAGSVESHGEAIEAYADTVSGVDRWVASVGGVDSGDCSIQTNPCSTISYAISQAGPGNTIHIAAGQYINPLTITTDGLRLVGEDANNKPQIKRISGGTNQPLLVINAAKNVHVENIQFDMDQTFVAEGILAAGFVDGMSIVNNHFVQSRSDSFTNSSYGTRNAISINDSSNSQHLARVDGSSVSITGNTIDGALDIPNGVLLRCGVDMDAGVGTISNNVILAGVHDIRVRFSGTTGSSSGTTTLIDNNTLNGRGLELDVPNATAGPITISNNHINAIAGIDDSTPYPADFSLMRLIGNHQNIPVTISGNAFAGYQGSYRGVLVENFPGTTFSGNTFTPASGATDFFSLVVSNKELSSGTAQAPLQMSLMATGNTFNGSGVVGAGRAVELLNDNDAGGTAAFGSLIFGGTAPGETNNFDGNLRWYFHLDDHSCDTVNTPCTFLDYAGDIGNAAATNTQVRPFTGNVSAATIV